MKLVSVILLFTCSLGMMKQDTVEIAIMKSRLKDDAQLNVIRLNKKKKDGSGKSSGPKGNGNGPKDSKDPSETPAGEKGPEPAEPPKDPGTASGSYHSTYALVLFLIPFL